MSSKNHTVKEIETASALKVINTTTKELIVLGCYKKFFLCREKGPNGRFVTFKINFEDGIPGSIITVNPFHETQGKQYPEISGSLVSISYCAKDLGIYVLPVNKMEGMNWSPKDECYGQDGEPNPDWFKAIAKRGKRPYLCFVDTYTWVAMLTTVKPEKDIWQRPLGTVPLPRGDVNDDPIYKATDLIESGNKEAGKKILMDVCAKDLRRLEAHSLLGQIEFDKNPEKAFLHYQMGVSIGELSLENEHPDPVLTWGHIENRPFLRCLHGAGLCLWRFGKFQKAKEIFLRILSFNPGDNQGIRFMLPEVERGVSWLEASKKEKNRGY